ISRLEAAGGVERWTQAVRADPALGESLERASEEQRRLRPELPGGIGGSTRTGSLKCLHAHAAFALARPGYELGERILAEVEEPRGGCRARARERLAAPADDGHGCCLPSLFARRGGLRTVTPGAPRRTGRERTARRRAKRRSSRKKLLSALALVVAFAIGV